MNKNKNLIKRGHVWYFKKAVNGKEERISLNTPDVTIARARRDALAKKMSGEKWAEIDGIKGLRGVSTIGQVLERYTAATQLQLVDNTVRANAWALRHVVRTAGNHAPDTDVDTLPTTVLNASLVTAWQQSWLKDAGKDRLKMDSAAVSANSILAQARSVFSKRTARHNIYAGIVLPDLSGFKNAPRLQELKRDDYHRPDNELLRKLWTEASALRDGTSKFTLPARVEASQQSIWLAFYLVSMTGMRRGELMAMRWGWFQKNGDDASVRIGFETDFVPKGKRERTVPVMATLETECRKLALEMGWSMLPHDNVLAGGTTVKEDLFRALGAWMKWCGWTRRQKAHELRKIFASDFLENADPYDAQLVLGHRDLKTTARYAARRRVAPVDTAARYTQTAKISNG